jgi:hypothetical protein
LFCAWLFAPALVANEMKKPINCHLWQMEHLTPADLHGCFERVEQFMDDSHHTRSLLKCRRCGQLYFYEFYEWIDWEGGNDPQYQTYIPVESQEDIDSLLNTNEFTILSFSPRLQSDFPRDAREPKVFWIGR